MKNLLIFILFLTLFGCSKIIKNNQTSLNFNCPRIFFSSDDRNYIDTAGGSDNLDNVLLKAELNNFAIIEQCQLHDNIVIIPLDVLIIAQPMERFDKEEIKFPLYVSLLDKNNNLLETQYFMISNSIKKIFETNVFIETDITDRLEIITENLETSQLVIGFMIDNKKRELLN